MMAQISVVVPTIGRTSLSDTLETLLVQSMDKALYEIIVVDDASEASYEWLPEDVKFIRLDSPKGPGGARNAGVSAAISPIVAFTDDDCLVPKDWLEEILMGFDEHPEVSQVNGYLVPSEMHLANSAVARLELYNAYLGKDLSKPVIGSRPDRPAGGSNNLAWRKWEFERIGGFKEFIVGQDGELERRADSLGMKGLYIPVAVIHNRTFTWRQLWSQQSWRGANIGVNTGGRRLVSGVGRIALAPFRTWRILRTGDVGAVAAAVFSSIAFTWGNLRSIRYANKRLFGERR